LVYQIENDEIEVIPAGTQRYGSEVIDENVLVRAKAAAQKVSEKYEDTGPWSDFECKREIYPTTVAISGIAA